MNGLLKRHPGWKIAAIIVLFAARIAGLLWILHTLPDDIAGHYVASDSLRYQDIATAPGVAYRDFDVEFPPVEYFEIEGIAGSNARQTAINLAWSQVLLDIVVVVALIVGWNTNTALAYLVISLPLAPFLYFRLDLLSIALATVGFAWVRRDNERSGGLALAAATLAKAWPLVLAPAIALAGRWRALRWWAVALLGGIAVWVGWTGIGGPIQVATFRHSHGWQIESSVGALLLKFSRLPVVYEGGANRIGTVTTVSRAGLSLVLVAAVAAATWLAARRKPQHSDGLLPLAAIAMLLLTAPILSWQYIAWLFPWAAICLADRERLLGGITLALAMLSALLIFQGIPLTQGSAYAENLLLVRNAVLMVLAAACFVRLARRPVGDLVSR